MVGEVVTVKSKAESSATLARNRVDTHLAYLGNVDNRIARAVLDKRGLHFGVEGIIRCLDCEHKLSPRFAALHWVQKRGKVDIHRARLLARSEQCRF